LAILLVLFALNVYSAEILGIHFAPDKDVQKPIVALYNAAERYIQLAIYSLTKDEFTEALIRSMSKIWGRA
jgi:hypothetical protein